MNVRYLTFLFLFVLYVKRFVKPITYLTIILGLEDQRQGFSIDGGVWSYDQKFKLYVFLEGTLDNFCV